jgi:hypothetical protein
MAIKIQEEIMLECNACKKCRKGYLEFFTNENEVFLYRFNPKNDPILDGWHIKDKDNVLCEECYEAAFQPKEEE